MENNLLEKEKILEVKKITKEFTGVKALTNFNFSLYKGEIHCLIGENGAGKSTFIKILSGAIQPNSGEIIIDNKKHTFLTPHISRKLGIQAVYQENILVPTITAAENIFLGVESIDSKKFFINYKQIFNQANELAKQMGINTKIDEIYERLSLPDQQFVKILKALAQKLKVLILDEPTQSFNTNDVALVMNLVKRVAKEGVSVIYIAHDLNEIIEVADRVTVLRDGIGINTHDKNIESLNTDVLTKEMIGRPVDLFYKKKESPVGDYVFEIRGG
jgi:ribose transport system ATP-binding protein